METTETILNVVDTLFSLWILVSLLVPGRNIIKDIAIPMLIIITVVNMLNEYPQTRDSVITIVGWIFGTDFASQ